MIFDIPFRIKNYFALRRVDKEMDEYLAKHPLECMSNQDLIGMIEELPDDSFDRLKWVTEIAEDIRNKKGQNEKDGKKA